MGVPENLGVIWISSETPSAELQHPEKVQATSNKARANAATGLVLEVWIFTGAWMLVLGAFEINSGPG